VEFLCASPVVPLRPLWMALGGVTTFAGGRERFVCIAVEISVGNTSRKTVSVAAPDSGLIFSKRGLRSVLYGPDHRTYFEGAMEEKTPKPKYGHSRDKNGTDCLQGGDRARDHHDGFPLGLRQVLDGNTVIAPHLRGFLDKARGRLWKSKTHVGVWTEEVPDRRELPRDAGPGTARFYILGGKHRKAKSKQVGERSGWDLPWQDGRERVDVETVCAGTANSMCWPPRVEVRRSQRNPAMRPQAFWARLSRKPPVANAGQPCLLWSSVDALGAPRKQQRAAHSSSCRCK